MEELAKVRDVQNINLKSIDHRELSLSLWPTCEAWLASEEFRNHVKFQYVKYLPENLNLVKFQRFIFILNFYEIIL